VATPCLIWVHYYDAHAPYLPPGIDPTAPEHERYAGELAFVDRQLGRLLDAWPPDRPRLTAVVGDHGESLGEHGERTHGIFLYRSTLQVPLIIEGPGAPRGMTVQTPVSTERLSATLVRMLAGEGLDGADSDRLGTPLPGLAGRPSRGNEEEPTILAETMMPATAYGWQPLRAITADGWRLIDAPRVELYDLAADPGELHNQAFRRRDLAASLRALLDARAGSVVPGAAASLVEPDMAAALESLGYVQGATTGEHDDIDPKDGIRLLQRFDEAKRLLAAGRRREAIGLLERLLAHNPHNVPFLTRLGAALLESGRADDAIAAYRQALGLNPGLHLLHLNLATALERAGQRDAARASYERTLELAPRSADAWLGLAGLASDPDGQRRILEQAARAGCRSVRLLLAEADLEADQGHVEGVARLLEQASELIGPSAELEQRAADLRQRAARRVRPAPQTRDESTPAMQDDRSELP
jgi:tetratricopeptide (TPR) repeat protein